MLQRDYMLNEARKLALLLAKLMGLKAEGNPAEYEAELNRALQSEYNTELAFMLGLSEKEFESTLLAENYSVEKLNALSQILYVFAEPFEKNEATAGILKKVIQIFDLLENKHHYESFDNLNKRSHIYSFFKDYGQL
ncbi:hypothetical protein DYU05_12565 [Mucilaginibacter terrenus]|uniref:Uncharacterized protein n=1 Tax=Mucilaginibacter terrenus TaxID=2482727 RepID=A0A3E2NPR8_9SPHI|nr:hypothetical protein [Mucilaginibacter terrenus]RFZ82982.1 hypothetical protein DYU05_12565 [Mucilaginibacter terrenus]